MLVLTRKLRETVRIDDQIIISILQVKGRSVRVGIEAPGHVRVVRGELCLAKDPAHPRTICETQNTAEDRVETGSEEEPQKPVPFRPRSLSTRHINQILSSRRARGRLAGSDGRKALAAS